MKDSTLSAMTTSKPFKTRRRIKYEMRPYTEDERAAMKAENLRLAQAWEAPKERLVKVFLNPGDDEYENAPEEETYRWLNIP